MPYYPQYQNAALSTNGGSQANYRSFVCSGSSGVAVSANSGDVIIIEVNTKNVSGIALVTLPKVTLGGPVLVKFASTNDNAGFGTGFRVIVIPTVADTVAGCLIDGFGSIKLNNIGDQAVFASDGVNWWVIDKSLNTTDTW